ncbi:unnamed protein product [Triticum turgidum subsp. durum]|uniref:UspA domain-containing protein n=1 Tax=Triticum turgidum subsp. durum TaxID=4567 RepID=A0A9R0VAF2_TRITD|nr:unnamed protein product [Triticum turgidum subsp. durum]
MAATHHPASPTGAGAGGKSPSSSPSPPTPVRLAASQAAAVAASQAAAVAAIQPSSPRYFFSSLAASGDPEEDARKKREEDFDAFTSTKSQDLAQPLVAAQIPFKIHIVKDHDMKERLCLEAERLGLSAMIMGSRGFGASRRAGNGRLGSVSDYCVHHCVCPVVVVRYPDDAGASGGAESVGDELRTVPENEVVFHEAPEGQKEN